MISLLVKGLFDFLFLGGIQKFLTRVPFENSVWHQAAAYIPLQVHLKISCSNLISKPKLKVHK
jgi:hypothetical protein